MCITFLLHVFLLLSSLRSCIFEINSVIFIYLMIAVMTYLLPNIPLSLLHIGMTLTFKVLGMRSGEKNDHDYFSNVAGRSLKQSLQLWQY